MARYASIKVDCRSTGPRELIVRYRSKCGDGTLAEWHTGDATVASGLIRAAADNALFARYGRENVTIYNR